MRAFLPLCLVLALFGLAACDSEPEDDTGTPSPDDTAIDDTGTPPPPVDMDGDGYDDTVDCDDNNWAVHPGAVEECDGLDNDCDGHVDEDFDTDADGQATCAGDCDDTDATIYLGAAEVPYDGIDQDCDKADLEDVDGDGFRASEVGGNDCDDTNPDVNPRATEIPANGLDDDCRDGDDIDGDDDGYGAASLGGDDCDDTDPSIHPDAEEICDDRDNDCDDVTDDVPPIYYQDADLDGYGTTADTRSSCDFPGGPTEGWVDNADDCDDGDEGVHPDAPEYCDDVDNDCDGTVDELDTWYYEDADGDGYGADETATSPCDFPHGVPDGWVTMGGDCDDTEPRAHTGATDWMNDGVDSDCDGEEPDVWSLDEAPIYIQGASGRYDLLGLGIDACDFDEDGLDDLILGSPFGPSIAYHGQVAIYYGANSDTWTAEMGTADADTVIEGDGYDFIGFNPKCGDIDGDGHADVVFSRGDISYSTYFNEFGFLIYYGDGTGFGARLGETDADAEVTLTMGSLSHRTTVYGAEYALGDIDGDGAEDLVVEWPYGTAHGEGEILVLPGAAYSGDLALDEWISDWWSPDQPLEADMVTTGGYDYQQIRILDDVDGDGLADVFVGEPYWSTTEGAATYEGQASFLSDVTGAAGAALADLAYGQFTSATASLYFGYWASTGDFDGDGTTDGAISAIGDATVATMGGGLWVWSDLAGAIDDDPSSPTSTAVAHVYGSASGGRLGYRVAAAGDMDGDGYEDLLVSEPFGGSDLTGRVWLLSGALLTGEAAVEDVAMWGCAGTTADDGTLLLADLIGSSLLGGADFDGDGRPDIALAAVNWDDAHSSATRSGRVAIWLSSAL